MIYCLSTASSTGEVGVGVADIPIQLFDEASTTLYASECETQATSSVNVDLSNLVVDNPIFDLFCGVMILYMTMAGVIWFFRKN